MVVGNVTNRGDALHGDQSPGAQKSAGDVILWRLGGDRDTEQNQGEDAESFHGGQVYSKVERSPFGGSRFTRWPTHAMRLHEWGIRLPSSAEDQCADRSCSIVINVNVPGSIGPLPLPPAGT